MSWTDERVELLKRLWTEGLSASQIAGRLGNGVTRNAVIGKVHRLNLSGRAPQPRSSVPRPRRTREPSHPGRSTPSIHLPTHGATALKPSMRAEPSLDPCRFLNPSLCGWSICPRMAGSPSSISRTRPANGRSATRVPRISASADTSRAIARPIANITRALPTSRCRIAATARCRTAERVGPYRRSDSTSPGRALVSGKLARVPPWLICDRFAVLPAILVADVVGYSRFMEADEVGALAALRNLRSEVLEPLLKEHSGRVVKTMGDGVLVEFASAVNAVSCALAIQQRAMRRGQLDA